MSEHELIHGELSGKLIGLALKVYNGMGYGHQEKYFQRAYEQELLAHHYLFEREKSIPLTYNGVKIGRHFLDFVVEGKIVVEFKVVPAFNVVHVKQVLEYLRAINLQVALLVYFTRTGVVCKRVVNPDYKDPLSSVLKSVQHP